MVTSFIKALETLGKKKKKKKKRLKVGDKSKFK